MRKYFIAVVALSCIFFPLCLFAEEGKTSAVIKLGLDIATTGLEKADLEKARDKLIKDKFLDWWAGSVGEYEKLWMGTVEGEAFSKQIYDKAKKINKVITDISNLALAMEEGKYDEALFASIDAAVHIIDHPVVKVTWAACKFTYQSHQAVKTSGAEVVIESLYGKVDKDRKLLGVVDPNSDSPPLIPITSDTVDHFFFHYLIKDDTVRGWVKEYVTRKLGQEWPEQTWSEWFSSKVWLLGSGVDAARSKEIEKLDTDFRNMARGWIRSLLKDVNEQAKVAWGQARLRQQQAAFQNFVKNNSAFTSDLPQLLKEFLQQQKYKKELPEIRKLPAESAAERQKVASQISSSDKKGVAVVKALASQIWDWQLKLLGAGSKASLIGEVELSRILNTERNEWLKLQDKVPGLLSQSAKDATEYRLDDYEKQSQPYQDASAYYNGYFKKFLQPYDFRLESDAPLITNYGVTTIGEHGLGKEILKHYDPDPERMKKIYLDLLNTGKLELCKLLGETWGSQRSSIEEYYNGVIADIAKSKAGLDSRFPNVADYQQAARNAQEKYKIQLAFEKAVGYVRQMQEASLAISEDMVKWMSGAYDSFSSLAQGRAKELEELRSLLQKIAELLPLNLEAAEYEVKEFEDYVRNFDENKHLFIKSIPEQKPVSLVNIPYQLEYLQMDIRGGIYNPDFTLLEGKIATWQKGVELWKNFPQIDEETFKEIQVFIDPTFNEEVLKPYKKAATAVPALVSKIRSAITKLKPLAENDANNRQQDADWLIKIAMQTRAWLEEKQKKGLIIREATSYAPQRFATGWQGYAYMEQPFKHYMTTAEKDTLKKDLKGDLDSLEFYKVFQKYAPSYAEAFDDLVSLKNIKAVDEENFILPHVPGALPVFKSTLDKAEAILNSLRPDDPDLERGLGQFNDVLPGIVQMYSAGEASLKEKLRTGEVSFLPEQRKMLQFDEALQVRDISAYKSSLGSHPLGQRYLAMYSQVDRLLQDVKEYRRQQWEKIKDEEQQREEAKKKEEEQRRKRDEQEFARSIYQIQNPRLNSYTLSGATGEVVVMRDQLKMGGLEFTGRLTTIEKVDRMLISEDGGRTWRELPIAQDISYTIVPMPGKVYQPIIKIRNTFQDEIELPFFPGVVGIVYNDLDFESLVVDTVRKIAEAYETLNLGLFSQYISRDYLGNKTFLEEGVRFDFDLFIDIKLTIYINRIERRGNMFVAETKWDKTQTPRKTGQQQRTSGTTTMLFVLEDGLMKIKNLRGNLLYATLSPEIAQASGLNQTVVNEIRTAHEERNPVQPGAGTTEDSGGTSNIESGTFDLAQNDTHAAVGWIQEYDFTTNQVMTVDAFGPTYDFRRREGWLEVKTGDGIQDLGAVTIDSVTEAPASGYNTTDTPTAGHTYALQLADGTYALVYIQTLGGVVPSTSSFSYKHQKSGTRQF